MTNIILTFENQPVTFNSHAYLNATQIAKRFNKTPKDYLRLAQTKEYISELSNGLNSLLDKNQIVIIKNGASCNGGGTWLHPKLTIDFARWLSAKFAVWCDVKIDQILNGKVISGTEVNRINRAVYEEIHTRAHNMLIGSFEMYFQNIMQIVMARDFSSMEVASLSADEINFQVHKGNHLFHCDDDKQQIIGLEKKVAYYEFILENLKKFSENAIINNEQIVDCINNSSKHLPISFTYPKAIAGETVTFP